MYFDRFTAEGALLYRLPRILGWGSPTRLARYMGADVIGNHRLGDSVEDEAQQASVSAVIKLYLGARLEL